MPFFHRTKRLTEVLGIFRTTLWRSHEKDALPLPTKLGSHILGWPAAKIEFMPKPLRVAVYE